MSRRQMEPQDDLKQVESMLEQANERLLDVSMAILSEAIELGHDSRPPAEKQIAKARRSIERALEALRGISID